MSFTMNKPLLMIPGPMDPPGEVLRRCGMPVFPHYEGDYPAFYDQLVTKMKVVFGLKNDGYVFIPSGSGTTAVNMMLASLCAPGDDVLVINNGSFGQYAEKNLKNLGVFFVQKGSTMNTKVLEESVASDSEASTVIIPYETSLRVASYSAAGHASILDIAGNQDNVDMAAISGPSGIGASSEGSGGEAASGGENTNGGSNSGSEKSLDSQ